MLDVAANLARARVAVTGRRSLVSIAVRYASWAPAPFAIVYLILLAAHFGATIGGVYTDADAASAPVIAALLPTGHASVVLGQLGWYSSLLFELATRGLPLHRQIWEAAPYAMALAAVGFSSWSVWRIAGRWAATVTAVLMLCAAPRTLQLLLSLNDHAPTWFTLALLGAFAVFLHAEGDRPPVWVSAALTTVVGVVLGTNAASDPLLIVAGIIPFALAVTATALVHRDRISMRASAIAGSTLVVAAGAYIATRSGVSSLHVTTTYNPNATVFGDGNHIAANFKLWWQSIATLGNGDFFGHKLSFESGLAAACAAISIAAIVALPRIAWQKLGIRAPGAERIGAPAMAFIIFWTASAALLTAAFLVSADVVDLNGDRYLVGLVYAGAAVVPVAAAQLALARMAVVIGASVFALAGTISMAKDTAAQAGPLPAGVINRVIGVAERNGLHLGYAGYWDAAPVTWASRLGVQVYPVWTCPGERLCRFYLHTVSSWYTPHAARSTFLLTDPTLPFMPAPPPGLGAPSAVHRIGQITMYVYPYDVATKIAP